MSFDTLAPHYHWMEWLFAKERLQQCRTAFLKTIAPPKHALLCGEGPGRFLSAFKHQFPESAVTLVDSSVGMLEQAKRGLLAQGLCIENVTFIQADARSWTPPAAHYDLIVTCFFLDCFGEEELQPLMDRIAGCAAPQAQWLNSDFKVLPHGWQHLRSRWTLHFLYEFFRRCTHITARRLIDPEPFFAQAGFTRFARQESDGGFLYSDWWSRAAQP